MYLFFDTETNGLPKNWGAHVHDVDNWPRMLQLAYVICDEDGDVRMSRNMLIKPEGFEINEDAAKVHGFTRDILEKKGISIIKALTMFLSDLQDANILVAHNIQFDKSILGAELIRAAMEAGYEDFIKLERICTMHSSTQFCALQGPRGIKWPKLQELHKKLFGAEFEDAHDALADVSATAKCFFELKKLNVIKI